MIIPPRDLLNGRELTDSRRAPFHWGGLLLERRLFVDVGGYCQRYHGWGEEDNDLLVKVAAHHRLVRAWQIGSSLACLHFEHPYPYRGTPKREANRALYLQRLTVGPAAMVEEDRAALHLDGYPRDIS